MRKDSVERRRRFSLRGSGRRGQRLRYAANTAEQRSCQPACQYLCGKQTHPRRTAAQQLLPDRQNNKGWPGADAGGQQSRSLLRGQFPAADCLGSGSGSRGKAAHKADEQHTARAAAAQADTAYHRPEQHTQHLACAAAHDKRRHHQKRKQRHQQRPAAERKTLPEGFRAGLRRGKH